MFAIIQAAGWPIWFLVMCSVVALALIIERFVSLRTPKVIPDKTLEEAIGISSHGLPAPVVVTQLATSSVLGQVLASGLAAAEEDPHIREHDLRDIMEASGRQAVHGLERYLPALATIASVAPLLGLLGTVIGMIEIFGAQAPSGQTDPEQLAHGISVALYNTAFGLMVAIPALLFYRYFRARVDGYALVLEDASERFLRHLLTVGRAK